MAIWFGYIDPAGGAPSGYADALRLKHVPALLVRGDSPPDPAPGIVGFVELSQAIGEAIVALDTFAQIEAGNAKASYVNGWPGDDLGYPVVNFSESPPGITFDRKLQYPTRGPVVAAVNMSFGPTNPFAPYHQLDPINFATRATADAILAVLAAGNAGSTAPARETMSAWAEAPWVLAVGATADEAGNQLADYSSVGIPSIPDSGPDVVSFGESELDHKVVGTSFAAPRVARSAAILASAMLTLRHFVQRSAGQPLEGIPAVGVAYIDEQIHPVDEPLQLRGLPAAGVSKEAVEAVVKQLTNSGREVNVTTQPPVLRNLISWAARPMTNYGPHQVGLGFLNYDTLESFVENFSAAHFAWLFANPQPSSEELQELAKVRLFLPDAVSSMVDLWRRATLRWAWDYKEKRFLDADGSTWQPKGLQ